MKLESIEDVERALLPYYEVASETTGKDITSERMQRLMRHLGNPEKRLRIIHIAGTSGKTSTTYYTAALLTALGLKVGSTVSPHVESLTERVQINGHALEDKLFLGYMTEFLTLIETATERPSWFELMVAFVFFVFNQEKVDYAVIETGLGGLHDATNVAARSDKLCLITDIGLDHQQILGDSTAQIAAQKAGIIHEGNTILMYEQADEIMRPIRFKVSQTDDAELFQQSEERLRKAYGRDFVPGLPLYQQRNWLLAYAAYRFIANRDELKTLSPEQLLDTQLVVPGRMESVKKAGVEILLDGAHNVAKVTMLVRSFKDKYGGKKVPVLLALKEDKDFSLICPLLTEIASLVVITTFSGSQDWPVSAINPDKIKDAFKELGFEAVYVQPNPGRALSQILEPKPALILVTGSFYLISELKKELTIL